MHHHTRPDPLATESFPTDPSGLPEAGRPELLELADGDTLELRVGPVAKRLGDTTVRMLGYNGSIPGPTLKVQQGSEIIVHVTNQGDLDTTVHWHGLRLENRYDGVPHETQAPIPVGGEFTYRIQFPDAGLYWYHPHIREDYTQELGLYGNILVVPAEPDYWPPADRDFVLTVDDLLVEDGRIAPFSPTETSYAAMGRFGNVFLTSGEPDLRLEARVGEVVRLWLTNTANTRVFNLAVPGARMKLVGGDSGRVEQEEFVERWCWPPRSGRWSTCWSTGPASWPWSTTPPTGPTGWPPLTVTEDGRRRRRRRGSSRCCGGRRSWRPSASSWTPGWPRRRTRSWPWSPRWTTRPPCRPARGRSPMPAPCIPRSPATSPAAVPSAA